MDQRRLDELYREIVDSRYKGIPLDASVPLAEVGKQGWNVARGDLVLPVTTLRAEALEHNITTMAAYSARNGVLLAPHGKTTMAPQLFQRQLAAGAWGITAATPSQVAVMRRFGVPRILLANELTDAAALRWLAGQLESEPAFEVFCLVDNPTTVSLMDRAVGSTLRSRRLPVLLEAGIPGGRCGVRTDEEALAVAEAVAASGHLTLAGVETYEGPAASGEDFGAVTTLLDWVRHLVGMVARRGLFTAPTITVTAGGSAYFDIVVARLTGWPEITTPVRVVLRSGCYLTQDADHYRELSPLDGRSGGDEMLRLHNALRAWALVLSRPEPGLAILGTGKRDVPYDVRLPMPRRAYGQDGTTVDLRSHAVVQKLNDQHAYLTLDPTTPLVPGDVVSLDLSHPCTAFDKFRLLPIIDDDHNVVDAVLTFF